MKERTDIGKKYLRKKAWYFLKKGCLAYTTYNLVFCVADRKRYTYIWIRIPLSTLIWIRSRIQFQSLLNFLLGHLGSHKNKNIQICLQITACILSRVGGNMVFCVYKPGHLAKKTRLIHKFLCAVSLEK